MNIFDQYLDKIKEISLDLSKNNDLILPDNLDGITAEIPPSKFDSDISTNVAMVLSKINKKSPLDLASVFTKEIKNKDKLIDEISIVKPGFINIKFKSILKNLFKKIKQNPGRFISSDQIEKNKYRAISDFISGMTDRYAINLHQNLK